MPRVGVLHPQQGSLGQSTAARKVAFDTIGEKVMLDIE